MDPFHVQGLQALQQEDGREASAADFVPEVELVVCDPERSELLDDVK
jgi:hypothetical protein